MKEDPTYNINVSGDLKQMLKDLGTEKAKLALLHGGGGLKAQKERVAALAAIGASKSESEDKNSKSSENKPMQGFSIVDAASASVHGRSAAAAKAGASEKTAARIALHMAGDRAPVNAKLVWLIWLLYILWHDWDLSFADPVRCFWIFQGIIMFHEIWE